MRLLINFTIFFTFLANFVFAAVDSKQVSLKPKEIYGNEMDPILVRIGNGGAGPTGILRALALDYLQERNVKYEIAWYQDISPNTLKQLQSGVIDIALVYEKKQIKQALEEGYAVKDNLIFYDHFLIVGPRKNPAHLDIKDSAPIAFAKIYEAGQKKSQNIFLSRDDNSGTNNKEKEIWQMAGRKPWLGQNQWYYKFPTFPKDALLEADQKQLYTITDWATLVTAKEKLKNTVIYIKGSQLLLNPCVALLRKNAGAEGLAFMSYLKSARAQNIIADFGRDKYRVPLFSVANSPEFNDDSMIAP